ncbi:host cell division inhibitor Icd-like protein [Klebsiella pneumoniae]|uniref:host cell division inhibitor Icd-like protein n=1 Tax=Klebsiella pneumoniae TaxID=573 RepID=UPI001EDFBE2C|nr:host cell division inhibitor Icd-like protein [Klebsiella pneumoniae]MEC5389747.1 host cell division inhibitor Icd-like protein [Klebsiella pneumoniae]WHQ95532.1 host cell division inhibitor Icd-like protein [Klebsiella pneumoniae]
MITGARRKSLSLAGLMYAKVNTLQAVRHRGNLSKPVTLRATDSGVQNAWQSFETITPAGKRSETDYLEDSVSGAGGGCGAHHTASYKLPHRNKKGLRPDGIPVYGYNAPAKSGAGIGVLEKYKATHDAPSVFFCVLTFAHPFFSAAVIIRAACRVMVSWMGAEKSAPVTLYAGYANPVQLTTSEIGVSGGGINPQYKEAAIVATTPTPNPQFIWIIAAVRRDMTTIKAQIHHIAAPSERDARRSLARDHVCFFAGRIRLEVAHA